MQSGALTKGKVERQIQYLRHAFFAARPFRDLDDLNAQFRRWRDQVAHRRRHPEMADRTVADAWAEEQPRLLPLPAHPFETDLVRAVRSGKTPYVRFDRNLYSIPHTHVRKPLTLLASDTRIRILDQQVELARHRRSYDTGQTVEDPAHLEGLLAATRQANTHTTRDRLRAAVPVTATLFERLAERGEPLRHHAPRCSPCSTTTDRRSLPPPSKTPFDETPSVPAPSPTSSKPDAGSAD